MKASCFIREQPHYRRDAFLTGLKRAGYDVGPHPRPESKADLLVIWNRYGSFEMRADAWERAGGTVIVAENGYIGADAHNHQLYAMSAHGHNGSGWFPIGAEDRFKPLNVDVQPWQQNEDGHLLICGQRGIGSRSMASPPDWHVHTQRALAEHKTKVRLHPGNHEAVVPLKDDLAGARACVVWSSSSGVKALVSGIPVVYAAPFWICEGAAVKLGNFKRDLILLRDDHAREIALQRMAWAQWRVDEIATGEPFVLIREMAVEQ